MTACTLTPSLPCRCLPCCLFFSSSAYPQTDTAQLYNTHPGSCTHMDRTGLEFNLSFVSLQNKNSSQCHLDIIQFFVVSYKLEVNLKTTLYIKKLQFMIWWQVKLYSIKQCERSKLSWVMLRNFWEHMVTYLCQVIISYTTELMTTYDKLGGFLAEFSRTSFNFTEPLKML